jgi:hypothetical protein
MPAEAQGSVQRMHVAAAASKLVEMAQWGSVPAKNYSFCLSRESWSIVIVSSQYQVKSMNIKTRIIT